MTTDTQSHKILHDLNTLFEAIDIKLVNQNVPIYQRYMKAHAEIGRILPKIPIPIHPNGLLPNNQLGNTLCISLYDFYERKYGRTRRTNLDLGFFYMLFNGDIWKYRIPNFYGNCYFIIDKDLNRETKSNEVNILKMCEEMTEEYVHLLSDGDMEKLFDVYQDAIAVFQIYNHWRTKGLVFQEAFDSDYRAVSTHLNMNFSNLGQAKWSYMQFAEKILKSWLIEAGHSENYLRKKCGHKISKLVEKFNEVYNETINDNQYCKIECKSDSRYQDSNIHLNEIIESQDWVFMMIKSIGFKPSKK